jgi:hypothetical protein
VCVVCIFVLLCIFPFMFACLFVCLYVCMSVSLSVCLYVCNSVCNYVCNSVCNSVYLSISQKNVYPSFTLTTWMAGEERLNCVLIPIPVSLEMYQKSQNSKQCDFNEFFISDKVGAWTLKVDLEKNRTKRS